MSFTKQEVKVIAIEAPLTGFTAGAGTIVSTDTVIQAIQKDAGNLAITNTTIGTIQTGNNLFNYYNFR